MEYLLTLVPPQVNFKLLPKANQRQRNIDYLLHCLGLWQLLAKSMPFIC